MTTIEAPFYGRRGFAALMTMRGITEAIEVGTDRGAFARDLLSAWPGMLWCIDPYEPYPHMPWDRTPDMLLAANVLAPFVPRVRIIRMTGATFIDAYGDVARRAGLVYIDADHTEEAVAADLETWWPVLKPGAILAGHDLGDHHPGVEAALAPFAEANDLLVHVVHDPEAYSWYVEKPLEFVADEPVVIETPPIVNGEPES